jgi:hypothetical protein
LEIGFVLFRTTKTFDALLPVVCEERYTTHTCIIDETLSLSRVEREALSLSLLCFGFFFLLLLLLLLVVRKKRDEIDVETRTERTVETMECISQYYYYTMRFTREEEERPPPPREDDDNKRRL